MVSLTPDSVFLSAGIPVAREAEFAKTADPLLIHSAVRALCALVFGKLQLVWGGHPAITPMLWAACENLGLEHAKTVRLYQSKWFEDHYPDENKRFGNITYTRAAKTEQASLRLMRRLMIGDHRYAAGVFVGGAQGVIDEFKMFRDCHPDVAVIVLPSTGGAARAIAASNREAAPEGEHFINFQAYFAQRIPLSVPRQAGQARAPRVRKVVTAQRRKPRA